MIKEAIESRLFALSRSHNLLTEENWGSAGLREVVDTALEPFAAAEARPGQFVIKGENIRLTPKATLAFGIAFHELATNAAKYGALSNDDGTVTVTWSVEPAADDDRLLLHWQERDGPSVKPPSRRGFGSRVMEEGLAHELEGTVSLKYPPAGVVCAIDIPVPRAAHG